MSHLYSFGIFQFRFCSFPGNTLYIAKYFSILQPVPMTIKKTLQEFKRTHQDNWAEHKLKFTEDQLLVMTDLLVSPNYYA